MAFPVRIFPANKIAPATGPAPASTRSPQQSFQASVLPALWPPTHIYSYNPLEIRVKTILPTWVTVRIGPVSRSLFVPPGTHILQVLAPGEARRLFPPGMNRYPVTVTPKGGSPILAARSVTIVGVSKPHPAAGATRNPGAHPILNRKVP